MYIKPLEEPSAAGIVPIRLFEYSFLARDAFQSRDPPRAEQRQEECAANWGFTHSLFSSLNEPNSAGMVLVRELK